MELSQKTLRYLIDAIGVTTDVAETMIRERQLHPDTLTRIQEDIDYHGEVRVRLEAELARQVEVYGEILTDGIGSC